MIIVLLVLGIIIGAAALLFKSRNENHTKSESYTQNLYNAQNTVKQMLLPNEQILLTDNVKGLTDTVTLTDKGIYYYKKGMVTFKCFDSDIVNCTYTNFGGNKVKVQGDVVHIKLKTNTDKCNMYSFPRAKEIALILDRYAGRAF